mmetsp:Transcript_5777/g.12749  ORF Transcript_5777/g.12749 Transcript_5777/m.12749 type:complete len:109 (+) Transcript_5777:448-774(+)
MSTGQVVAGPRTEQFVATLTYDFCVDDEDPSYNFEVADGRDLPFIGELKKFVLASLTEKLQTFVSELQQKGASAAAAASQRTGATSIQKPVAVQVGKHQPGGKKVEQQ